MSAVKDYGTYQQSSTAAYKAQFDGTAAQGRTTADTARAKGIGQQISQVVDRLQIDQKGVQCDKSRGKSIDLPRQEDAYAANIASLHNLEVQYAQATGDTSNRQRLQANPDETGLGTTNELLKQAGVINSQGQQATDKDFSVTGTGSADGVDRVVTAQLNDFPASTQATAGNSGSGVVDGSSSGSNAPPLWWSSNPGAGSGGEGF